MVFKLSLHAQDVLQERKISEEWMLRTLNSPDSTNVGNDGNTHCFKSIQEYGKSKEEQMKLKIDKESDALYFRLDESAIVESEEVQPGVILDYNAEGKVVGIEMLGLSMRTKPDQFNTLQFETVPN